MLTGYLFADHAVSVGVAHVLISRVPPLDRGGPVGTGVKGVAITCHCCGVVGYVAGFAAFFFSSLLLRDCLWFSEQVSHLV